MSAILQSEVMSRPTPHFTKDDMVKKHGPHGPYEDLHIYEEPYWADWLSPPGWMYNYDYGLGNTSEGSAPESLLRALPRSNSVNPTNLDLANENNLVFLES